MKGVPIRVRLTAWYSAVLLAALVLFGTLLWFALENRLMKDVDLRLQQRVDGLRTVLVVENDVRGVAQIRVELEEFTREIPDGELTQLRAPDGQLLLPAQGGAIFPDEAGAKPELKTIVRDGRPHRLLAARFQYGGGEYAAVAAAPLEPVLATMAVVTRLLLLLTPLALAIACIGGYWLSRRALAPVDEITRVARDISVHSLSQRIDVPHTGDELERMADTWNQVLARLEDSVARIEQFTADASHELRTPLALIRTSAELALRREREPGEYRRALAEIQQEAERMTRLTEALLALARSDSGTLEMATSPVDLNGVVLESAAEMITEAKQKGLALETQTSGEAAPVRGNVDAIRELLHILLDNAIRYTPTGGCITVATEQAEGGVLLSVRDNGCGIPPDALPHLFERFYRLDAARSAGSGFGLGLSIAQAIAQAHRTGIQVESTPGAGSRFSLLLPTIFPA